jgi:ABC-type Zn2+ transport system substrate-binding protein/surface adhesin
MTCSSHEHAHEHEHEHGGEVVVNNEKQSVGHKKVNEIDYNIVLIWFQCLPESVGIFSSVISEELDQSI